MLRAVNEYTEALLLLDQYDHQTLCKPDGSAPIYRITYDECTRMVGRMKDSFHTDVFGVEKRSRKSSRYNCCDISKRFWTRCISIGRRESCKFIVFYD